MLWIHNNSFETNVLALPGYNGTTKLNVQRIVKKNQKLMLISAKPRIYISMKMQGPTIGKKINP